MKASRVSILKVTRTPGRLLRRLYRVRFMEDTSGKIKKANVPWQMVHAHEGRGAEDAAREAELPTMSHKTWQAENVDVLLGRTRLATVAPFPACPRSAVLRLALCPCLSRVSPFTFVLTRLHSIAIFSVHTIQALCFSNFFFDSHFLLSFWPWNRLKSQFSCPRWWWVQALHFPCSLCLTQHLQLHPNPREIGKTIVQHFLMDLFEEKFLANSMNSLTQQQWQEILLRIEEAFALTPPCTCAQVQSKVHNMQKKFNQLK